MYSLHGQNCFLLLHFLFPQNKFSEIVSLRTSNHTIFKYRIQYYYKKYIKIASHYLITLYFSIET